MSKTVTPDDIRAFLIETYNDPKSVTKTRIAKGLRAVKSNTDLLLRHIDIMTMYDVWVKLEAKYAINLDDNALYNPTIVISLDFLAGQVNTALANKVVPMRR